MSVLQAAIASRIRRKVLEDTLPERREPIRGFLVKTPKSTLVVRTTEVIWFEADDNYVRLHTGDDVHLIRSQLTALEDRLDPRRFVRVHRSAIVSLDRVTKLEPLSSGDCNLVLNDSVVVRMSRRYRERFEDRLQVAP